MTGVTLLNAELFKKHDKLTEELGEIRLHMYECDILWDTAIQTAHMWSVTYSY